MEGLVRTALSDKPLLKEKISKGGGYALLGADGLIWLLDDSYQTEHHGPQAAQNSWAKATQIEEGESFLIMGGRVVTAYSNFTGLDAETIHKDDHGAPGEQDQKIGCWDQRWGGRAGRIKEG